MGKLGSSFGIRIKKNGQVEVSIPKKFEEALNMQEGDMFVPYMLKARKEDKLTGNKVLVLVFKRKKGSKIFDDTDLLTGVD